MRVAAYTGTRNLYESMIPAVKSLIMHSNVDKIYLLIEDNEFPYFILTDIVECINVKNQRYFPADGPNMNSRFTYMAMMRATYAEMFPDLDRILSLDVDTIVVDDVSDIWKIDFNRGKRREPYLLAASQEPDRTNDRDMYVNIGVAFYNLTELRKGASRKVINVLNDRKFSFVEQDAFNMVCKDRIEDLESYYNATKFTLPTEHPKIIHFAGQKQWQDEPLYKEYMDIPWELVLDARLDKGEIEEVNLKYYI